jgi:hypothetical protein
MQYLLIYILISLIIVFITLQYYKKSICENFSLIDKYYYDNCKLLSIEKKKVDLKVDEKCEVRNEQTFDRDTINMRNECYNKIGIKNVIDMSRKNICNILSSEQQNEINTTVSNISIPKFEGPEYINNISPYITGTYSEYK